MENGECYTAHVGAPWGYALEYSAPIERNEHGVWISGEICASCSHNLLALLKKYKGDQLAAEADSLIGLADLAAHFSSLEEAVAQAIIWAMDADAE